VEPPKPATDPAKEGGAARARDAETMAAMMVFFMVDPFI
jgi:hypothetical protein